MDASPGMPNTELAAKSSGPSNAPGGAAPADIHTPGARPPRRHPQRRARRPDRRGAAGTEPAPQQQGAISAHRPAQKPDPGGVEALAAQHRDELVQHHRAAVFAGSPFMPITSATVDSHYRERRQAGGDGLGQPPLDPALPS